MKKITFLLLLLLGLYSTPTTSFANQNPTATQAKKVLEPFYIVPDYWINKYKNSFRRGVQLIVPTAPQRGTYAGVLVLPESVLFDPLYADLFTPADFNNFQLVWIDSNDFGPQMPM